MNSSSHILKVCSVVLCCCAAILYSETAYSRSISCKVGVATAKKEVLPRPLGVSDVDSCNIYKIWLYIKPQDQVVAQEQYDSLRLYVEHCANIDSDTFNAFAIMDGAVGRLPLSDTGKYDRYRDWLISVLFLSNYPRYFCCCLESISRTYFSFEGEYKNIHNAPLAVYKYIQDNYLCGESPGNSEYQTALESLEENHLDTTCPPLDSIGLGFLDSLKSGVAPTTPLPSIYVTSYSASPNPFKDETTLSFVLNRMTYTTVEVFDVLGRKVLGDDHGYSLDAGLHTVHIDGTALPSGSLYARISTGFGEVQTVKLVHE